MALTAAPGGRHADRSGRDGSHLPRAVAEPDLASLPRAVLDAMWRAGAEVLECRRGLAEAELTVTGAVLKHQGRFVPHQHFPRGDVYDRQTHAQYYYHAHRPGEHGHFHCFLRAPGMPPDVAPVAGPSGARAVAHLVAVSMDRNGEPIGLFTTNRWVTGETFYPAAQVIAMLPRFVVDEARPSRLVNRWLAAMLRLFRPEIEALIEARDAVLAERRASSPERDVLEDRALETLSEHVIDVAARLEQLRAARR